MNEYPDDFLSLFGILCAGLFLLAFGAGGVFLIITYFRTKKKTTTSQSWTSTSGVIQESDVRESRSADDDSPSSYYAHIVYTYQVMGLTFRSSKIHLGARGAGARGKAQQVAARYPLGAAVTVFYDPANPGDAVLERAAPANSVTLILGIIFFAISLCLLCGGFVSVFVK